MRERDDNIFSVAENQIELWISVLEKEEKSLEKSINKLIKKDDYFSRFHNLPCAIKEREKQFVGNSIKGIWDYLDS